MSTCMDTFTIGDAVATNTWSRTGLVVGHEEGGAVPVLLLSPRPVRGLTVAIPVGRLVPYSQLLPVQERETVAMLSKTILLLGHQLAALRPLKSSPEVAAKLRLLAGERRNLQRRRARLLRLPAPVWGEEVRCG